MGSFMFVFSLQTKATFKSVTPRKRCEKCGKRVPEGWTKLLFQPCVDVRCFTTQGMLVKDVMGTVQSVISATVFLFSSGGIQSSMSLDKGLRAEVLLVGPSGLAQKQVSSRDRA